MTIDKWFIGGSAREPERAGSSRLGILASREKRLGSFQAREPLRAEPSRSEPEPELLFLQPYSASTHIEWEWHIDQ